MNKYTGGWERTSPTGFFAAKTQVDTIDTAKQTDEIYRAKSMARPLARSIMKALGTAVNNAPVIATPIVMIGAHRMKKATQIAAEAHFKAFAEKAIGIEPTTYKGPAPSA